MMRIGNQVRSRTAVRSAFAIAMALSAADLLTSCNTATLGTTTAPADIDVLDKVRSLDILPRQAQSVNAASSNAGERGRAAEFQGTEITEIPDARIERAATGNGYDLNFENTPVATVAKVVLGDILNTGYSIDPRVQGTVSLVSVRPVPKSDIVFVLENALRLSGVVLVRDSAGYRLTPLGDAVGTGRVDFARLTRSPAARDFVVLLICTCAPNRSRRDSMGYYTPAGGVRANSSAIPAGPGHQRDRRTAIKA